MIDFTAKAVPSLFINFHSIALSCQHFYIMLSLLPCQHVATSKGPLTHIAQVVGLIFGKIIKEIIFQSFDHFLEIIDSLSILKQKLVSPLRLSQLILICACKTKQMVIMYHHIKKNQTTEKILTGTNNKRSVHVYLDAMCLASLSCKVNIW